MRKNKPRKTSTFTVRVPEKLRFALDLLCERHQASITTVVTRAIEDLAEREKLTTREGGEMLSLLDKLYDASEYRRLTNLKNLAPELLSSWDKRVLDEVDNQFGRESLPDEDLDQKVAELRKFFAEF
jgi:hypothetical protein